MNLKRALERIFEISTGPHPIRRASSRFLWFTRLCLLFKFEANGVTYRFFPSSMSAEMWSKRQYLSDEIRVIERLLHYSNGKGQLIIDIGANVGVFSLTLARKQREYKYVAIEPHPKIFRFLQRNVELNKFPIDTLNMAIGSDNALAEITTKHADDMNEVSETTSSRSLTVQMRTLDSLFTEDIELIKIDVEGMEKSVLEGATESIMRTNNIFIEVDSSNYKKYGVEVSEVLGILEKSKFRLIGIDSSSSEKVELSYPLRLLNLPGENIIATRMQESEILQFLESVS